MRAPGSLFLALLLQFLRWSIQYAGMTGFFWWGYSAFQVPANQYAVAAYLAIMSVVHAAGFVNGCKAVLNRRRGPAQVNP